MLHTFESQYELPCRKYLSTTAIPRLYITVHDRIATELADIDYFVVTSDMWSSETGELYMSYTVHCIDRHWKLQSHCLQALDLPDDHTANILQSHRSQHLTTGIYLH